ncbi:MAG: hypothetical protein QMC42_02265 [Aquiluna sp.]
MQKQGAKAADALIDILESNNPRDQENFEEMTIWPIELVVRSSTAKRAP